MAVCLSDRRSADQAERVPEHLWRLALDHSFCAVVITDAGDALQGPRMLHVNARFCRMTGYRAEELLGRSPRMLQGPQTDPAVLAELRTCLRDGRVFQGCTFNYRKDGSPYEVEWQVRPVRDALGVVTHFVSTQREVGELVAAQSTSELLAKALDATLDGVVITDTDGVIEFVNQGFQAITGYPATEVLGRTPSFLASGQHDDAFYRRLWRSLKDGQTFRATFTNRHRDGHLIHCEETISPVQGRGGAVTHYVSVIKDLTERVRAEHELRELATQDALTGLLNRRAGELQLESAYLSSREAHRAFCVMLIDVDHFKQINDRWGHPAGDAVLQQMGTLLRTSVRATDAVVRWGGEEFLLVLNHCEAPAALDLAERIRERVARTVEVGGTALGVSIGVAQMASNETIAGLINRADKALYRAKREGRNRVCEAESVEG